MIRKFKKKPVIIEAVQYEGVATREILDFVGDNFICEYKKECMMIKTLEGVYRVSLNDWIIKGVVGEVYPCKPDIFKRTYKEIPDKKKGEEE